MNIRICLGALGCVVLLGTLSACSSAPATIDKPMVTTTTKALRSTTALPSIGYIHGSAASVRSGAGLAYKAIGGVQLGEEVAIVGKNGDWYEIRFGENQTGFVSGQFVRFTPWVSTTTTRTTITTTNRSITTGTPSITDGSKTAVSPSIIR